MSRIHVEVQGIVQGVGFRPCVYRLALERQLTGWVRNRPDGVEIELQGPEPQIKDFLRALKEEKPAPARIEQMNATPRPELPGETGFRIESSGTSGNTRAVVPPDLATCSECAREVATPGERRFRYPFTNCTYCGPRYSIIEAVPYDRPRTSMKGFAFCPDCEREYRDPLDRRFHAQPVACPSCGPSLRLLSSEGLGLAAGEDALLAAAKALLDGRILALKGLGGFQLLVDATSATAVNELRQRKRREEKPFAVMFPDLETLLEACEASAEEQEILQSPEAPILLLRRRREIEHRTSKIENKVAPRNPRIGAFLPYTPLHTLLLAEVRRPVVCTSGNLSEEPMAYQDQEAMERLGALADLFLVHDRPVVRPVDDSVLRMDADGPTFLRRARGYAPRPIPVTDTGPPILAFGAQQKNTVALLFEGQLVVSQHLGDLSNRAGALLLERTVADLLNFFRVQPEILACDLHPDYASTRFAERFALQRDLPLVRVQHHHAHAAACAAELGLEEPVLALAWDGNGLGSDGTSWGGEALLLEGAGFRRVGHLQPFPLPGGDKAAKEPRRSACGLLWGCLGPVEWPAEASQGWTEAEFQLLRSMLKQNLNCPRSSSMGRLFDAVAALAGIRGQPGFEGQAAMELEFAAGSGAAGIPWSFAWTESMGALVAGPGPLLEDLLRDRKSGVDPSVLAQHFHASLAELALAWARHAGVGHVLLTGGCFQNALLTGLVTERLQSAGFQVHRHRLLPPNDGAISAGQAVIAGLGAYSG
jgi:hydrogenase maturation protein HypF